MGNRAERECGLTLVEIMVILAVIAIIAAAMVPRIAGVLDEVKTSRAQSEVQAIGMAILRFNAHTGKWPARNANGDDHKLLTLVSGSRSLPVPIPAYSGGDINYFGPAGGGVTGDYLDDQLRLNQPQGNAAQAYPIAGMDRWNGPYLHEVKADPWGHAYCVNIVSAYDTSMDDNLYCYVISAGADGIIQTDAEVKGAEVGTHTIGGDDIVFLVRARR